MSRKVALVTGASSVIGFDVAVELKNKGFVVYGATRRVKKLKELESKGVKTIQLDVTDEASMVNCVETIVKKEGSVDVLVNNAGYGSRGGSPTPDGSQCVWPGQELSDGQERLEGRDCLPDRLFRNWTGMTVGAYRKNHIGSA